MLIIGCGNIGCDVASHYLSRGIGVVGLVHRQESGERLRAREIEAVYADLDDALLPHLPTGGRRVFYFAPPPGAGQTDPRMQRFVASLDTSGNPTRIVYISTTGVYGDCRGQWVDENRPVAPTADRSRRRLDAENTLRAWSSRSGGELVILRVAGIYGPGRLPVSRLKKRLPMVGESEAPYTNRIHAQDLVRVCIAAMDNNVADGQVYNVCDGHPGPMSDYFNRVADLLGLPRPPTITLQQAQTRMSAGMMSYLRESRRLSNRKIRVELGVELRYPTLDTGLPACREIAQGTES